jgi:hypothetical protein
MATTRSTITALMALAADCIVITGPPAISTAADIARGTTIMAQPLKVTNTSTMASSGLRGTVGATLLLLLVLSAPVEAQDDSDLAKKTQNPVADLISVPFENNIKFGVGPHDDVQYILNIQPVIPFRLTDEWNLISRTIAPVIYQPRLAPGLGDTFGLGDIQQSFFLSPAKPGAVIWGAGVVLQFPTATDDVLGQGKWGAGPTAAALTIQGPWVIGTLINNVWSFAGDGDRKAVNQMLLQPFVNYNFPGGWYVNSVPKITADWEAHGSDRWTVPIGGGVGKILRIGALPLDVQLGAYGNVVRPDNGPEWELRAQAQCLFPR